MSKIIASNLDYSVGVQILPKHYRKCKLSGPVSHPGSYASSLAPEEQNKRT